MNVNDVVTDGTAKFVVRSMGFLDLLDALHPIGDIYLTVKEGTPFAKFGFGQWKLVGQNKCLWGGGGGTDNVAGTEIEAGLPNITGRCEPSYTENSARVAIEGFQGAFISPSAWGSYLDPNSVAFTNSSLGQYQSSAIAFDASRSNPIYGKSTTVQPPAYVVYIWQRIA